MKQKIYQVDTFTNKLFSGNPAAVCPLDYWLDDQRLQQIAAENNLAETAYYVKTDSGFHIRWFTPVAEVDLCGHATLAAAYILFELYGYNDLLSFQSRSGILTVTKNKDWMTLNFPADKIQKVEITPEFISCFNIVPTEAFMGLSDYMFVFSDQKEIENLVPNLDKIAQFKKRGIIVTSKGNEVDFVSRYFAPAYGIDEDYVTGSAHTTLTAYWSERLNKMELEAVQLSDRKGYLKCNYLNGRVEISGQAVLYLTGELYTN